MDVVAQLVGDLRQESCVCCHVRAGEPWRIRKPACPAPSFYAVFSGTLSVSSNGKTYNLSAGDFLVLPHGKPHEIRGEYSTHIEPKWLYHVFAAAGIERWKPDVKYRTDRLTLGEGFPSSEFLAGLFYFGEPRKNPLLVALPEALLIRSNPKTKDHLLRAILDNIVVELEADQPGSSLAIAKSADLLFIQAVRAYLQQKPHYSVGWVRGIADSYVGRAFAAMHAAPERPWTLRALAKEAGCSRASFARRFRSLVGRGALAYLTDWRMHVAAGLLLQGDVNVTAIAYRVGYRPDSFAKAFKRWSGMAPRHYRSRVGG